MKTFTASCLLSLFFLALPSGPALGQWIQQLSVSPAVPVSTAPVSVVASLAFPSGDCNSKALNVTQVAPGRFEASSLHCLGLLTFICNDADTFDLGLLPAGSYRFVLKLDAGMLPDPCTPGMFNTAYDSVDFTVTVPGAVKENEISGFSFFPNPAAYIINISLAQASKDGSIVIRSPDGKVQKTFPVNTTSARLDLSGLAEGIYLVSFSSGGFSSLCKKLVISRHD